MLCLDLITNAIIAICILFISCWTIPASRISVHLIPIFMYLWIQPENTVIYFPSILQTLLYIALTSCHTASCIKVLTCTYQVIQFNCAGLLVHVLSVICYVHAGLHKVCTLHTGVNVWVHCVMWHVYTYHTLYSVIWGQE